jgi:membrane protein YdbS with pleckstrin-like domain
MNGMQFITLRLIAAIAFAAYAFGFRSGVWMTTTFAILIVIVWIVNVAVEHAEKKNP